MTDTETETTSQAVEDQLVFEDHALIHLHNGTYQWVDIQMFVPPTGTDDRSLLELLIRHKRYRHSYAAPEFHDAKIIHGPYWLEAINLDAFSPISVTDAEALISTWANFDGVLPDNDDAVFSRKIYAPIREASSCYQLADLRATAEHDWGHVVGFTGFHEFVLINRGTERLTLLVASDD